VLRTEVLFLRNAHAPSEDEQASCYAQIAGIVGRRALTIRLLDLGADKQSPAIQWRAEPNPALGLRGVRLLFAQPELLRTQLRAVFRAAAGQRVRLLVPMVVDAADVERVRELTADAAGRDAAFDIGAMVETPAAALMAEELASAADFLSIGTNDLVQYVLAADREAAHMAAFYQVMHPAVLRLIDGVMAAAARHARPVSVCGEAAADPRAIPLFLGLGVTELSVLPSRVPRVKAQVREVSIAVARRLAEEVAGLPTAAAVAARLQAAVVETTRDVRETGHAR
jgi:phosphoenolpyruvate-protein kinase (PTS system EI component)